MDELIAQIEAASGPDRELDAQMSAACRVGAARWEWANNYPEWLARPDGRVELEKNGPSFAAPALTGSIDAAMTLVPEECEWRLDSHYNLAGVFAYPVDPESGPYCVEYAGESSTPALALCAAALRARAA